MTQEEIINRNEAIWIMSDGEIEEGRYYFIGIECPKLLYNESWGQLMPAYEYIQSLGYHGNIEKLLYGDHRVWFNDKNGAEFLPGNRHEDLKTAIWLTVSDFAMDFNNKKDGKRS